MLCETFLNDNNCKICNIDGYSIVEKHRTDSTRGGVAIFINNKHKYKLREDISIFKENCFESVFLEVESEVHNVKNCVIGEIYKVPGSDLTYFWTLIQK